MFLSIFLMQVIGSPTIPRENEVKYFQICPFSLSSSHLSFLPKACFHSCILLLMFTLCGPPQKLRNILIDLHLLCDPKLRDLKGQ